MLLAADLCFLYLHVSQNTALYRNTEKRLQQKSSRTESFVFLAHMKIGQTQLCCVTHGFTGVLPRPMSQNFIIWNAQSIETSGTTKAHQDLQCSAVMNRIRHQGQLTALRNIWAVICGLSHNMGGIGCCLLRNVYAAARHNGEILHHMGNWVQINWLQAAASQRGLIKYRTQINLVKCQLFDRIKAGTVVLPQSPISK